MNLWCCLWFNRKKEEEEEEKCNFFKHMNNNGDILGNTSDDEDESEEAKVFQGFGSWPGTRRSEGESSCVNAGLVPVSRPESPVADENRDSSHKRAKFYNAWVQEIIGKCSYGVVCSAIDIHIGEKVAIKKINDVFEHVSDATRILGEIKLLRLLRHPDLHQVIKANDDLTPEHHQFC